VAMVSLRDATMAIFLGSPSSRVVPFFMWSAWQGGRISEACAAGILLVLGVLVVLIVGRMAEVYRMRRIGQ
jgi:ABC-type Fe3+ transport system permease subunit